jgi:hypothetical protein
MTATISTSYIFAGQQGSGKGFRFHFEPNSLVRREFQGWSRVEAVEETGGKWRVVDRSVAAPAAAELLARDGFAAQQEKSLSASQRKVSSNTSYEAARGRSITVRIWTVADGYLLDVEETSRWEGESDRRYDAGTYPTLKEAREAAEKLCQTQPSFGDPQWA